MKTIYLLLALLSFSCQAQPTLKAVEIYNSRVYSYVSKGKEIDPAFFGSKRFWLQYETFSILGNDEYGIKYIYDFETKTFTKIGGLFSEPRPMLLNYDYTGGIGHNFYFANGIICWLTKPSSETTLVLRTVDIRKNRSKETLFVLPKQFQGTRPIIIDTCRLLYQNFVLDSNGKIDTLQIDEDTTFPFESDKIFMRRNGFMIDKYSDQENPKYSMTGTNPIDYNQILNGKMVTKKVACNQENMGNYRVETNQGDVWLLSHKIYPEKFMLYDIEANACFPFLLDKTIFKLENLSPIEPIISTESAPGQDVKFSYFTSMTKDNIYIYTIKDGIKLYKISEYQRLIGQR